MDTVSNTALLKILNALPFIYQHIGITYCTQFLRCIIGLSVPEDRGYSCNKCAVAK